MRSIELQTTQNVRINYEIALVRDRIFAFILDMVVVGAVIFALMMSLFPVVTKTGMEALFFGLIIAPITTFYSLLMESLNNGQTLGKMALRIQVVRVDGKRVRFLDYLLRWVFRLLDIWFSAGTIAVVLISSSPRAQRLGDLVGNTTVVHSNPRLRVRMKDLMTIGTLDDHVPVYPAVRRFREQDMLAVKQAVDRFVSYGNEAHREALQLATDVISQRLELEQRPENELEFLRTVIKDYIVLTR